jgi:hypothetical protein
MNQTRAHNEAAPTAKVQKSGARYDHCQLEIGIDLHTKRSDVSEYQNVSLAISVLGEILYKIEQTLIRYNIELMSRHGSSHSSDM